MITFQILTHLKIRDIQKVSCKLNDCLKAKSKKISYTEYLITVDASRAYIRVNRNGFDVVCSENSKEFINNLSKFIECEFSGKHLAIHLDMGKQNEKYIEKIIESKLVDISIV